MRILAISGSARAASTNTALLRGLAVVAGQGVLVDLFDRIADLPVFSPDAEGPPAPPVVEAFAARLAAADALVIASPEYVHALPGGLKNAIDWLVSRTEIIGKPAAILHGSHRGDEALAQLRRVMATVSTGFAPAIFERFALNGMTPDAVRVHLAGEAERAQLERFVNALRAHVTACRDVVPG